jgi:hypothetical protein
MSNGVVIVFLMIFSPLVLMAKGLVPCGDIAAGEPPCQFCHLFVMFDRIIDFLLTKIVPPLAVLMLVIGGLMFMIAYFTEAEAPVPTNGAAGPSLLNRAKKLINSVIIGLVIIYGAWLVIGLFFQVIGLADWTAQIYQNWWKQGFFTIPDCPI